MADQSERSKTRRWIRRGLLVLGILLLVDLAWSGLSAFSDLSSAKTELEKGGDLLVQGDLPRASGAFSRARDTGAGAVDALGHPSAWVLSLLPWIGDDVDAARTLGEAADLAGQGGVKLVEAARAAGWDGEHLPGFGVGGAVHPEVFVRAEPSLADASELLARADSRLQAIDVEGLLAPLADAVGAAQDAVAPRAQQAQKADLIAKVLPGFLGADGLQTYLLVMLQPSDPRGSGGYPGMYALFQADGTRIRLQELQPTNTIPKVAPVPAPVEVRKRYDTWGSRTMFWDTTYTPDFPTAARLMLAIWKAAGNPSVDGVIAVDASLLAGTLQATGPIRTPAWPDPITAANVEQVLGRDTYLTTSEDTSNRLQTAVGTALWQAVFTSAWSPEPMMSAIAAAAGTRHLQIYTADPVQEEHLSELNVAGEVTFSDRQPPLVTLQGVSANRAGYFARFETTSVERTTPAGTEIEVTVRMENSAPDGPPSILLGVPADGPVGQFAVEMNMYLPPGAQVLESTVDGQLGIQLVQHEYGRPVVLQYLIADAGKSSVAVVRYLIPAGTTGSTSP